LGGGSVRTIVGSEGLGGFKDIAKEWDATGKIGDKGRLNVNHYADTAIKSPHKRR